MQKANNYLFQSDIQKSKLSTSTTGSKILSGQNGGSPEQQAEDTFQKSNLKQQKTRELVESEHFEYVQTSRSSKQQIETTLQKNAAPGNQRQAQRQSGQTLDEKVLQFQDVDEDVEINRNAKMAPEKEQDLENDQDINQFFFEDDESDQVQDKDVQQTNAESRRHAAN